MANRISTYPDATYTEMAVNVGPLGTLPPWWIDISARALGPWDGFLGVQYELDRFESGEFHPVLDNRDGGLDAGNAAGSYAPNLKPYRRLRNRQRFNPNELTGDQATAGESTGQLGAIPVGMNVVNDLGYPLTVVASGTAFQGAQVYQAVLPSGAAAPCTVLMVQAAHTVPGYWYSFTAQARIPSGNSVSTQAVILWFDAAGNSLASTTGAAVALTSGSSTWVALSASGQAPAGAYSASLKVQAASGTLSAPTTWQIDGLQFENSAAPTPFQAPGTIGANAFPRAIATGTASIDPTQTTAAAYFYPSIGSVAQAANLTPAPTGQSVALAWTSPPVTTNSLPLYAGVVGPLASDPAGPVADCAQVAALAQYTASVYVTRASSADATVQVQLIFRWIDAAGSPISVSVGTTPTVSPGSWARATVTANAPANAAWVRVGLTIVTPSVTTATNTIYATSWQLEQAAAASSWVDPGITRYAFTGYFEQLPQQWKLSGTRGESDAVGVDGLAGLARRQIKQPFIEELQLLAPSFVYELADPAGSSSVVDTTGNRQPAPIETSPAGAGSLTLGSSITSASAPGTFLGTAGPVATLANNPSQASTQEPQTFVSLHETTLTPGPPSGPWTRMISFRCSVTPTAGNFPTLWAVQSPVFSSDLSYYLLYLNPTTGTLSFEASDANGSGPLWTSASSVCDGNWHQVAICWTAPLSAYFDVYLDGVRVFHDNNGGVGWNSVTSITTDVIGANVIYGRSAFVSGWVGDAALAVQFPFALSTAQAASLYSSWRSASSGESTGARVTRLLSWVGWPGPTAIDNGSTASMGPATDLVGGSALDALNAIAETEGGWAYASTSGAITFKARSALYNSSPQYVFGEHAALGEWPYEDVALPTDPILTYNIVPVAQYSTGQVATAQDPASQDDFWQRTLPQRTVNSTSFAEVQAAAAYLLGRHKTPAMRCASLVLNTAAVPGLARVAAQLEIGTRIRIFKRPPGRSTPIQFDGFVQRIERSVDPTDGGAAFTTIEAFPADTQTYWVLAALHTTLSAQAAAGQSQATIRALPDAARNPLAASLPQGYQLVFDIGTPQQETMTIASGGIPSTNVGYQTAVLTFTSNFAFTHNSGAVVCEPLPAGYTDPTAWDAASVLGASSTTVISGGAAGTNTITVGPLADAAVNALGSTWNVGDLLRISPGTARDEGYNLLRPNQATAGEGVIGLAAGTNGQSIGVSSALGSALVTASASAFQGANVWQVSIAANAGLFRCIRVPLADAAAGVAHTWSVCVRSATTGANPVVNAQVIWFDANGATLSTVNGATATLTGSPTAAWTRISVSATAPATAVWAALGVPLNATAPSVSWLFQADALQWESNGSASPFCVTPQVKSVAASVPGYSSVQITLNTNLINSHNAGDIICDQLPPGVTSPSAVAATTRLAY